jgi:hypothetical protein
MFGRHQAHEVPVPGRLMWTDPSVPARACCCPARPVVKVLMLPTPGRAHPVDLWLCGHHYRACLAALHAAGTAVEDLTLADGSRRTTARPPRRRQGLIAAALAFEGAPG